MLTKFSITVATAVIIQSNNKNRSNNNLLITKIITKIKSQTLHPLVQTKKSKYSANKMKKFQLKHFII